MRESRARLLRRHDALQLLVEVLNEREIGAAATIRISSLRYLDAFVKVDGAWLFSERQLYVDWIDERPLS